MRIHREKIKDGTVVSGPRPDWQGDAGRIRDPAPRARCSVISGVRSRIAEPQTVCEVLSKKPLDG
ncbi:MAG: hypothetical protein GWO24_34660 [Akkermansiaceae bacterium]|nr:hypothetical protein [Akkermansiaceae bacterium]